MVGIFYTLPLAPYRTLSQTIFPFNILFIHNIVSVLTVCGDEQACLKFKIKSEELDACDELAFNASDCIPVEIDSWPLILHFQTNAEETKPGFNISYEFPSCSDVETNEYYYFIDFATYDFSNYTGNYDDYEGMIPAPSPEGENKGTVAMTTVKMQKVKYPSIVSVT